MNEDQLTQTLERRVAEIHVGPPPLREMHVAVARQRRNRVAGWAGAAVAVGIVTGTVWLVAPAPADRNGVEPTDPTTTAPTAARSDEPPPGKRWVGIGRAVIAVPKDWPTNDIYCGIPRRDGVWVDVGAFNLCDAVFPTDTVRTWVRPPHDAEDMSEWTETEIDGAPALVSRLTCQPRSIFPDEVCTQLVYIPSEEAVFDVTSTAGRASVDELVSTVSVLDDGVVAVPGFTRFFDHQDEPGGVLATYQRALDELDLSAELVHGTHRGPVLPHGWVEKVSPPPGTVVEKGSTVVVTRY